MRTEPSGEYGVRMSRDIQFDLASGVSCGWGAGEADGRFPHERTAVARRVQVLSAPQACEITTNDYDIEC